MAMDKLGVVIDPDRVPETMPGEKVAGSPGSDPEVNVPVDPDKGTEPFEKRPDEVKKNG